MYEYDRAGRHGEVKGGCDSVGRESEGREGQSVSCTSDFRERGGNARKHTHTQTGREKRREKQRENDETRTQRHTKKKTSKGGPK
jgi:hypothetical protein